MALNYSHRPLFPAHIFEDNLISPMRIVKGYLVEGVPEKNSGNYVRPRHEETKELYFNRGRDRVDLCCSPESNFNEIVDLLPSDPFGMDIQTTFTAIAGWLEDLEVQYGEYVRTSSGRTYQGSHNLFASWNLIWNDNVQFNKDLNNGIQSFPSNPEVYVKPHLGGTYSSPSGIQFNDHLNVASGVNNYGEKRDMGDPLAPYDFRLKPVCNKRDMGFSKESTDCSSKLESGETMEGAAKSEEMPHEALFFALGYLEVKDLLSVGRVCKSLGSTVQGDPLLWKSIHIYQPLSERITDDLLLQLAHSAQGNLQCLSLVECSKVTDDGIKRVLETSPQLTKLSVPGRTRLSVDGILSNIKTHNSNKDVPGVKNLRIGGIYGVTNEHFEELILLLGNKCENYQKPHFYHRGNLYLPCDDDRAMDIEMCPRCEKFRLVCDCPAKDCQAKDKASQVCRACTLCIARCAHRGRCINDNEYEENFCLELVCSDCFKQPLKCSRQAG